MDTIEFSSTVEEVLHLTSNVQEPFRLAAFQAALTARLLCTTPLVQSARNGEAIDVNMPGNSEMATTFEEFALQVPKDASNNDKFVAIAHWLLVAKGVQTFHVNELMEYFGRTRWLKPTNPQDVANQCQKRGLFSSTGQKKDGYKEWRFTKSGLRYVEGLVRGEEPDTTD